MPGHWNYRRDEPPLGGAARAPCRDHGRLVASPKGWRFLARRARIRCGEVDLIARRGKIVAFIEAKARASDDAAAHALDPWTIRRVLVAAERLAPRYVRDGDDMRIDAVYVVPGRWPRHLPNIWHG